MAQSIVPQLTKQQLIELFQKEAKIGADGSVTFSRRGTQRLTLLSRSSVDRLTVSIFGVTNGECAHVQQSQSVPVSDSVVIEIINHCAFSSDKRLTSAKNRCIHHLIKQLIKKGYLTRSAGARAITITHTIGNISVVGVANYHDRA